MATLKWRRQALKDLEEIEAYYEDLAPSFARHLIEEIFRKVQRLEHFPHLGRIVPEIGDLSIREVHVRGYRVMHFVTDDKAEIEILAIHHSAQQFGSVEMDDP